MHSRAEILRNQKHFSHEIRQWFKKDLNETKRELVSIESEDPIVLEARQKLELKSENIEISKEINKFIINEKNIYPKFYAWWNEDGKKVEIFQYETR